MKSLYRMHAEFCRTLAHAKRLEILELLRNGEANVTQLAKAMDLRAVNVSQELAPLRSAGIVQARRDGKTVYYRLSNAKILRACDLIAQVMRELTAARAAAVRGGPERLARGYPQSAGE